VALYSLGSVEILDRATDEIVARLAEWSLLRPHSAVLDIGCGIGGIERALAPQVGRITAIDVSAGMIAEAPAYCPMVCDLFDGADHGALSLRFCIEQLEFLQGESGEICRGPCPEIFRRNLLAADFAEVIIDVGGVDRMSASFLVDILEQLVAGQITAIPDDPRQPAIIDVALVPDAAFAAEAQMDAIAFNLDVPTAQGRQAKALVRLRVFGIADAKQGLFP